MTPDDRRARVQGEGAWYRKSVLPGDDHKIRPGSVPWSVHLQAWEEYARQGHGSQSAERVAERGGFGYYEIQCLLSGECHPYRSKKCTKVHPPVPGWEADE